MSVTRPSSVLFVCGMNAIRSPMAQFLTRALYPDIYVASAGVHSGTPDPFATAVLAEEGLALDNHNPRALDDLEEGYFDLIVTLTPQAHHVVLEKMRYISVDVEYWPTPDPALADGSREQVLEAYRAVRDALKKRIIDRFGVEEQAR